MKRYTKVFCFNNRTRWDQLFADTAPQSHAYHKPSMEGTIEDIIAAGWQELPYREWGKLWFCPFCAKLHLESEDYHFKDR